MPDCAPPLPPISATARGFTCAPESIVVTNGMRQSLSLLAWLVLDPDEAAWIEEPGYVGTREALALAGVRAAPIPVDEQGFSRRARDRRRAAGQARGGGAGAPVPAGHDARPAAPARALELGRAP